MIVGINFTGEAADIELLEDWRKVGRFRKSYRSEGKTLRLQGITDSYDQSLQMVRQANNGRRLISVVAHKVRGKWIHAVYIY